MVGFVGLTQLRVLDLLRRRYDGPVRAVTRFEFVEVCNPEPVSNIEHPFKFGSRGSINKGGRVQEIGRDDYSVLVEYTPPMSTGGSHLPAGAIFFLTLGDFEKLEPPPT